MPTNITGSKTVEPPYVIDPKADAISYDIIPLITVGDEAPLLEGTFGNFTPSTTETFAMAGIPDGLGYVEIEGKKYVFMNHELSSNRIDRNEATTTTATNSTGNKIINGARVSLFEFDANWNLVGGKNLIEDVLLDGVTYSLNTTTGNYEDPNGNVLTFFNHENFTRFCSGYLAAEGFVDANGNPTPIWFAPQERSDGVGTPVQATTGLATPIRGLGTVSKENVLAASQYRANNSEFTVLLASEDNEDGEAYLYVGRQTANNPNGFWGTVDANGNNDNFQLYVLRVKDAQGNVYGYETMPENVELVTEWVPIPDDIAVNPDPSALSDYVNEGPNIDPDPNTGVIPDTNVVTAPDTAINTFRSTNFRRLEDMAEDPENPGTFYFVTTGRNEDVPVNSYSQPNPLFDLDNPPQGRTTQRDNALGKLHRFDVSLDANGIPQVGTFETLLQGGLGKGVSYDNIVVDSNGNVLIQEDETADGDVIFTAENRDGSVLRYNINANENRVGNDVVDFVFEINSAAADTADISFFEIAGWETSGIIQVDPNALPGQSSYLFDIQASTISTSDSRLQETQTYKDLIAQGLTDAEALAIVRPAAEAVLGGQYERGGQLFLVEPTYVNVLEIDRNFNDQVGGLIYNSRAVDATQTLNSSLSGNVADLGNDADFDNVVGFYEITNEAGGIDTDGNGTIDLTPTEANAAEYARFAISNAIPGWQLRAGSVENTTTGEFGQVIVAGDSLYAPFIIANAGSLDNGRGLTIDQLFGEFITTENAEADGVFNDAADFIDDLVAYFAFDGANPDGARHLQVRGVNLFGFEDLPTNPIDGVNVSDNDFNDAVFQFDFTLVPPTTTTI